MGSNDQIMQRGSKSFNNVFSSNVDSVYLIFYPGLDGKHT